MTDDPNVTVEVVNSSGLVMPFEKSREGTSGNRYQYVLVPGETYSYVATRDQWYHTADTFTMEDAADSTISAEVPKEDWLTELAFGTAAQSANKNNLMMDSAFDPADHSYQIAYVDTEHLAYIWVNGKEDVKIQAMYDQIFRSSLYHGRPHTISLTSGIEKGTQLNRFLMDENPIGNTVTIRLTKEMDGITVSPVQMDGTTGYSPDVKEYDVRKGRSNYFMLYG